MEKDGKMKNMACPEDRFGRGCYLQSPKTLNWRAAGPRDAVVNACKRQLSKAESRRASRVWDDGSLREKDGEFDEGTLRRRRH